MHNNLPIIKIFMIKILLIALFTYTALTGVFITPAYPPTAYQNQFYSLKFRIRGADFPVYRFSGLPEGLSADSDGTITGVPASAGSFAVKLTYTAGSETGVKQFILKVTQDDLTKKNSLVSATKTNKGLVIAFPDNLIFRVGQKITLKLKAEQGTEPYVWAFLNLPQGLTSDSKTGQLQGYLQKAGYYNLNVEVADKNGKSASAFLTINAKPSASLTSEQTIQVQVQNTKSQVNLNSIENEQVEADNALFKALDNVSQKKKSVSNAKQALSVQTLRHQNANNSSLSAEQAYSDAVQAKAVADSVLASSLNALNAAQKNLELAMIEYGSSGKNLKDVRDALDIAQKRFNEAQKQVEKAESALIDAKNKFSEAEASLRDATTSKKTALEEYKRASQALEVAKTQLEDAKTRKSIADQAVKQAEDALDLATQARDDAENGLSKADYALTQAEKKLNVALAKVSSIRDKYNAAKNELSAAQWEYELKINQLYIAQARKQAADRASAIALAQGSLSDHNTGSNGLNLIGSNNTASNSVSSSKFLGCSSETYPPIRGTSQVKSVSANGYTLASGHQVVYGGCSKVDQVKVGDWVQYNGFIVNSVVNVARIERVLLS